MTRRSPHLLLGAVALSLGACSKTAPAVQAAATVVTVTGTDFAFGAPDTLPAGLVTLRFENAGKEPHQMVVMRIDSGKTMADLQAIVASPQMRIPAWLTFPVGVSVIMPGDSGTATAVLNPGHYVMACFIAGPDGVPHIGKGMVHALEVAASGVTPAPEPTADLTITEKDYDFVLSGPLTAGTHTIRVDNAGPQVHELAISQLAPGKTLADVQAWLQGGMKGPPPAKPYGGVTGPDVGGHEYFTATFAPGTYVLMCFIPDQADGKPHFMHGMIKEITVS